MHPKIQAKIEWLETANTLDPAFHNPTCPLCKRLLFGAQSVKGRGNFTPKGVTYTVKQVAPRCECEGGAPLREAWHKRTDAEDKRRRENAPPPRTMMDFIREIAEKSDSQDADRAS
jgi:hypothetical protein